MAQDSKKVAFITGGNRGVGLQTARDLGKLGVTVVIGSRDAQAGKAAVDELQKDGIEAEAIAYDARKPDTDGSVYAYLEKRFGRLDILVNNAGMMNEELLGKKSAATLPEKDLRETFDVNFFAVVRLTQKLLPLLRKSDAGRIVNLSSILGSLTIHTTPNSPLAQTKALGYNASKTALNAFTVHLADELADTRIKVNSAHPGWVKTALGGVHAPMEIGESGKTSVRLATLGDDGPTGGFFHENDTLPW